MLEGTAIFSLILQLLTKCKVRSLNKFSSLALKGKKEKIIKMIYHHLYLAGFMKIVPSDSRSPHVDQSALLTGFRTGFTSSVWNFCRWVADVPPRETSPAAKSEEKRMFSQTMFSYPQNCSIIPSLVGSVIAPSDLLSDSFCVLNKQRLNNSGLLAISLAMCCSYGNLS